MFAYGSHAAVAKVIDIVDNSLRVDETDQVFNDQDDILFRQNPLIVAQVKPEFFVNPVATNFTEIITLFAEEQALDDIAGRLFVRCLGIPKLAVDILHSFLLGV